MKLWIARDEDGRLNLSDSKPERVQGQYGGFWALDHIESIYGSSEKIELDSNLFPEVKWEDDEPTRVELKIVKKWN